MSFWRSSAVRDPVGGAAAGGEAALGEIWSATREAMVYADNANARAAALERAYQDRIDAIAGETGARLDNPMLAVSDGLRDGTISPMEGVDPTAIYRRSALTFQTRLEELARQYPDHAGVIGADRAIAEDAAALARTAEERSSMLFASRSGIGRWLASFGGGMIGSLNDPVTVATLFIGAGPSAATAAGGRILSIAAREALLSGASEAAVQPIVQDWRRDAGLDAGFDQALRNVGLATLFGGTFGAVFGTAGEAFAYAGRQLADRAQDPTARAVLAGEPADPEDLVGLVESIRDALPPEARGALDALETERVLPDRLAGLDGDPGNVIAMANRAAVEPRYIPGLRSQIEADLRVAGRTGRPVTLSQFLAARGGISDDGEFAAQGFANPFVPGQGMLFRGGGRSLDEAREMAAEAGYFPGAPSEAMANTTVADFIDLVREELNRGPVFSSADADLVEARRQLQDLEDMQRRLDAVEQDLHGEDLRDLSPELIDDAARLMVEGDGVSADDAIEQAILADYYRNGDGVPLEDDDGRAISQAFSERFGTQRPGGGGAGILDEAWPGTGRPGAAGEQSALALPPETSPELLSRLDPPPAEGPEPTQLHAEVDTLRQRQAGQEDDLVVPGAVTIDADGQTSVSVVRLSDALKDVEAVQDEALLVRSCKA